MNSKKLIIFDFDGTIADSFEASVEIFNEMVEDLGMKKITSEKAQEMRDMSSENFFKTLNISKWRLPFFLWKARKKFSHRLDNIFPLVGMPDILRELKRREYILVILTSNSGENIKNFLHKFELEIFDEIFSGAAIFGKDKKMKKIINKFNPEEAWCVGDETRDVLAAKKSGARSVAVSWGLNSEKILRSKNPDCLINHPRELLGIFPDLVGKK